MTTGVRHQARPGRTLVFAYGVTSYLVFLASFLYAVGFVGNLLVPKSIDLGGGGPAAGRPPRRYGAAAALLRAA